MVSLKFCLRAANPWRPDRAYFRLNESQAEVDERWERYRPNSALDGGKNADVRKRLRTLKGEGRSAYEGINHLLRQEDQARRDMLIEGLEKFQTATGIDESEYIARLEKCLNRSELNREEAKLRRAAAKYYEKKLDQSGVFTPIDVREEQLLKDEKTGRLEWFGGLPLYSEQKEATNMVVPLVDFDKNIQFDLAFRTKLKAKSKFIQGEYFRLLEYELKKMRPGQLPTPGRRGELLDTTINGIKEVEDAPEAVQHEFKTRQEKTNGKIDTKELAKTVNDEFAKKAGAYRKVIQDNLAYFGGEEIKTPYGKMPEAAWEYIEWFENRANFAKMDDAAKKLPAIIEGERKPLYAKVDDMLQDTFPEHAKSLRQKIKKMRFHELKAYLPQLDKFVRSNNLVLAEFTVKMASAYVDNFDLFDDLERAMLIQEMRLKSVEEQRSRLVWLNEELKDREQVAHSYLGLPAHVQELYRFEHANAIEKKKMLLDGREQLNREAQNPFDLSGAANIEQEDLVVTWVLDKLDTAAGEHAMDEVAKNKEREGELRILEGQDAVYQKVGKMLHGYEGRNISQKAGYGEDLAFWMRQSRDRYKQVENSDNARQVWQYEALQTAGDAFDADMVFTSGFNEIRELGKVSTEDLVVGKVEKIHEEIDDAKYTQHVVLTDEKGQEQMRPHSALLRAFLHELRRLLPILIQDFVKNELKLSDSQVARFQDSREMRLHFLEGLIDDEHKGLKSAANNNNFYNELAA